MQKAAALLLTATAAYALQISPSFSALDGGGILELWMDQVVDEEATLRWLCPVFW